MNAKQNQGQGNDPDQPNQDLPNDPSAGDQGQGNDPDFVPPGQQKPRPNQDLPVEDDQA